MRIKADLYSGRLCESGNLNLKKRDHQTLPVISHKVVGGKIPYSIGMKDDSPFILAGLWEGWKDPATDEWRSFTGLDGNSISAVVPTPIIAVVVAPPPVGPIVAVAVVVTCDNSRSRTGSSRALMS
jgi:hypothetical protein